MTDGPAKEPKKKRLRWESAPRRVPRHPYRDSAILYAILAGIVVGVTALTGGNLKKALVLGGLLFVVATAYSWGRWREQEKRAVREEQQEL